MAMQQPQYHEPLSIHNEIAGLFEDEETNELKFGVEGNRE